MERPDATTDLGTVLARDIVADNPLPWQKSQCI
jgi:hypothetical protein